MGESDLGGDTALCGTCPFRVAILLGRLPQQVVGAAIVVLALGLVLAVLEFIYLSFIYPSNLSTVIGVVTPMVSLFLHSCGVWRRRRIANRGDNGDTSVSREP